MKVLYLFSGSRVGLIDKVKKGDDHGNGFWGMLQLPDYGIEANYIEIEQFFPLWLTRFLRKYLNIYFIHLPLFWKIFSYDIVFTSSAFGLQFFHALFGIKKPIWVMHDFNIKSFLGEGKTFRQKMFKFMVLRSGGVVTLSIDEKNFLENKFPYLRGKVEYIPFGINTNFFKPKNDVEISQILAVGLDPDRDWHTLIEAVKDLDIPVVLATRESRIEKYKPLSKNITVKLFTSKELVREYDKSAIVIVPLNTSYGTNDAMGCSALFEAMAMGKTVIATRTKAMESYVESGTNGVLVNEGSVDDMKKTIDLLMNDKKLRKEIGDNAYQYALKNLDINICTKKLAEFFKKLK